MESLIIVILPWGSDYYELPFYNLRVVYPGMGVSDIDNNTIQGRLDAVQEILQTEDMFHSVAKCIFPLSEVDSSIEGIPRLR